MGVGRHGRVWSAAVAGVVRAAQCCRCRRLLAVRVGVGACIADALQTAEGLMVQRKTGQLHGSQQVATLRLAPATVVEGLGAADPMAF